MLTLLFEKSLVILVFRLLDHCVSFEYGNSIRLLFLWLRHTTACENPTQLWRTQSLSGRIGRNSLPAQLCCPKEIPSGQLFVLYTL